MRETNRKCDKNCGKAENRCMQEQSSCPLVKDCWCARNEIEKSLTKLFIEKEGFITKKVYQGMPGKGTGSGNGHWNSYNFWWARWRTIKLAKYKLPEYTITFRCDNYRDIVEDIKNGKKPDERPGFDNNSGNPHDFGSISKIQFVESRHKFSCCSTATSKDVHGEFWFPDENTNKPNFYCKNRPGKVWPLSPKKPIEKSDVEILLLESSDYSAFISADMDGKYFEIGTDGKPKNDIELSDIADVFHKWVTLVEKINKEVANTNCQNLSNR